MKLFKRRYLLTKNIVVVSGVAVGMFFIIFVACCTFLPDIYDRNPDYAKADMEETGATVSGRTILTIVSL